MKTFVNFPRLLSLKLRVMKQPVRAEGSSKCVMSGHLAHVTHNQYNRDAEQVQPQLLVYFHRGRFWLRLMETYMLGDYSVNDL